MVLYDVSGAGDRINSAIQAASRSTGTSFDFLLRTAARESAFDPTAKASTSSARGLFQFIDTTWLTMMKEEGPRFGLSQYAGAIEKTDGGRYVVHDPAKRAQILALRDNPTISALMAGALASRNAEYLGTSMGRPPSSGELYIAHFLGASGARKLISLAQNQPAYSAARAFPDAARANRTIFYRRDGSARSAADIYAGLVSKHDVVAPPSVPQPGIVQVVNSDTTSAVQPASQVPAARLAARNEAPRVWVVQVQLPDLESPAVGKALRSGDGPIFQSMFRTEQSGALSDGVREIWGGGDTSAPTRRIVSAAGPEAAGAPADPSASPSSSPRRGT